MILFIEKDGEGLAPLCGYCSPAPTPWTFRVTCDAKTLVSNATPKQPTSQLNEGKSRSHMEAHDLLDRKNEYWHSTHNIRDTAEGLRLSSNRWDLQHVKPFMQPLT
jgi:hypothetical protein